MLPYFKNILIPVDFTANTDAAVNHAIAVADAKNTIIHLLHVNIGLFYVFNYDLNSCFVLPQRNQIKQDEDIRERLTSIKRKILLLSPTIEVLTCIDKGKTVQERVIDRAKIIEPDLIVISMRKGNSWPFLFAGLDCSAIAKATKCAILKVSPATVIGKMKTIVMPLQSFLPYRKLALLSLLTRNQKPTVHLLTMFNKNPDPVDSEVFIDTYRSLSQAMHFPVNHKVAFGQNTARNILRYACDIKADLIMVNPSEETVISRISGRHITDLPNLKFSILMATPV